MIISTEEVYIMSKEVGYARVSSTEQNLSRQIEALKQYVPEDMIVTDKASGKDFNRPGYQSLKVGIGKLQQGDVLYIKSLDRFSRDKYKAKEELKYFSDLGVRVKILDIPTTMEDIPTGQEWVLDMINNILIEVLASVAENERKNIKQRQSEGNIAMPEMVDINGKKKKYSKKTGKPTGRPAAQYPENWKEVYTQWKSKKITSVKAMKLLNLKKNTFYNLIKRYEN